MESAVGSAAEAAIRLQEVRVGYSRGRAVVQALRGVTFEVSHGDFVALQGPSGSGKSTLLRVIAGLWPVTSGHVFLDGVALERRSDADLSVLRRRQIGFVHQLFNLLPDLTAAENVGLPLVLDGLRGRDVAPRVEEVLAILGVASLGARQPEELSGGELLRVAIARALVINPKVILADEPTGSLDRENGRRVLEVFQDLHARGVTLVVATHDDEVAAAAERRLQLVDGRIE